MAKSPKLNSAKRPQSFSVGFSSTHSFSSSLSDRKQRISGSEPMVDVQLCQQGSGIARREPMKFLRGFVMSARNRLRAQHGMEIQPQEFRCPARGTVGMASMRIRNHDDMCRFNHWLRFSVYSSAQLSNFGKISTPNSCFETRRSDQNERGTPACPPPSHPLWLATAVGCGIQLRVRRAFMLSPSPPYFNCNSRIL